MSNSEEIYDEWLVLRCQGGDAAALAILVTRWQPRLLRFAVRVLGERDAAEDVVQSAWVDVVKRMDALRDPKAIRPWLFQIVANKCTDVIRKRSKRRQIESSTGTDRITDPGLENQQNAVRRSEQIAALRRQMKSLEIGLQEVLRLHYLDELSIEAIANRLSIPKGTVKSRLYHARQKLKQTLEGGER